MESYGLLILTTMIKYIKYNRGFGTFGIIIVVTVFLSLLVGVYFVYQRFVKPVDIGRTACSAEAKLCPDGSVVGRIGPNCEFAECPKRSNEEKSGIDTSN